MQLAIERMVRAIFTASVLCVAAAPGHADPGDALDTGGGGVARRYVLHAQQALENGRLTEATDYCNRAIALYPAFIFAHFTLGEAMLYGGQYDVAIRELSMVIAAHPEYPLVFGIRGQAYLRARQPAMAVADFNQALRTQVGTGSVEASRILSNRSLAFELLGRNNDALADFDQSLRVISGNNFADWRMLQLRCYNAMAAGLLESAAEACDESISRHSRNEFAYDTRGLVELKTHDWNRAIADFTQSLYYRPEATTSLYGRGLARRARGDTAGAAADFAAAQAGEPHIAEIFKRWGIPGDVGNAAVHKG
jgi:tetratricopeptide (TPR) repeat protein